MGPELLLILGVPAVLLVLVLGGPRWAEARRRRLRAAAFPAPWRALLEREWPLFRRLPPALRRELEGTVQVFLAEKRFVGCGGLETTERMRLLVAAQACLLVADRPGEPYPGLTSVLLYPSTFRAPHEVRDEAGVHHVGERELDGESWADSKVILAWDQVEAGLGEEDDGVNVVVHEFAHQLDEAWGREQGASLPRAPQSYAEHSPVLRVEYARLRQQVDRGRPTLLDPYAAESPVEFMAVATEAFIERPEALRAAHPRLYEELTTLYRLDPVAW